MEVSHLLMDPLSSVLLGWDWIPEIRDRDTGIWQKVFLSSTGPILLKSPLVMTDLPLPKLTSANVTIQTTVENITDKLQKGVLKGSFGNITFLQPVEIAAHSSKIVFFNPKNTPQLHVLNPKLWWPNGYGPQNLYKLKLSIAIVDKVS